MTTRIVQVPMDESEAEELTGAARKLGTSRADLIRRACRVYLDRLTEAELDLRYEEGYRRVPEDTALAEASASLAAAVLPPEDWS